MPPCCPNCSTRSSPTSPLAKSVPPLTVCMQTVAGQRMARDFDRQVAELQIRAAILNRFTGLGTPILNAWNDFVQGKGKGDLRLICATAPMLSEDQLVRAADSNGTDEILILAEQITKGPEHRLPEGWSFTDKDGTERHHMRQQWWNASAPTWRDIAISEPLVEGLPDADLPATLASQTYPTEARPVFYGQYWLTGAPVLQSANALCLDYSAGKDGPLVSCDLSEPTEPLSQDRIRVHPTIGWSEEGGHTPSPADRPVATLPTCTDLRATAQWICRPAFRYARFLRRDGTRALSPERAPRRQHRCFFQRGMRRGSENTRASMRLPHVSNACARTGQIRDRRSTGQDTEQHSLDLLFGKYSRRRLHRMPRCAGIRQGLRPPAPPPSPTTRPTGSCSRPASR